MTSQLTNVTAETDGQVLLFPPEPGIGVLAVSPPYVIGYKPLNDGALGVNYNMVHSDTKGLLVYILAYLGMTIGDQIDVYLGTGEVPVASLSVTEKDFDAQGLGKNIPFYIPAKTMEEKYPQPGNLPFRVTVKRVSGNPEDAPPYNLFYKGFPPGEPDIDGGKPFNQGLKLPIASETIVDQNVIAEGMTVTVLAYLHQAVGDLVELAFGILTLSFTVTDPTADIVFELTPELLAKLPFSDSLVVRYLLTDKVHNQSGWSDALTLQAKPGIALLPAPIVEKADEFNVVNHDELAGAPLSVLITGVFAKDDRIELTLEGLASSGDSVSHTYSQTLLSASRTVYFPVENERVQALIRGSLRLRYTRTRMNTAQHSKPANVTISGSAMPWRAPVVEQATDGQLPSDTAIARVRLSPYWPLKAAASVSLFWQVTGDDGVVSRFIFGITVVDPTQPIMFSVPNKYIEQFANSDLIIQCEVQNPESPAVKSELLKLKVGARTVIWVDVVTNFENNELGPWQRNSAANGGLVHNWGASKSFLIPTNRIPASPVIFSATFRFPPGTYEVGCYAGTHHTPPPPNVPPATLVLDIESVTSSRKVLLGGNPLWHHIYNFLTVKTTTSLTIRFMIDGAQGQQFLTYAMEALYVVQRQRTAGSFGGILGTGSANGEDGFDTPNRPPFPPPMA